MTYALFVRSLLIWFIFIPAAWVPHAYAQQADPDSGLRLLQEYLARLDTLTADFSQEVSNSNREVIETAAGRVYLKRPGRFRWDYDTPFERTIVTDGERVWLYEADLEQVTIRRLGAGLGATPAALLTDEADLLDRFQYQGYEAFDELIWVYLRPESAESDFDLIALGFIDSQLVEFMLEDRLGQRTNLSLSGIKMGVEIEDRKFSFTAPKGVDVIGETDL